MTTVASRTFNCIPRRDAGKTWTAIVDLLTQGKDGQKRQELLSVTGVAASTLADQAARDAAITVTCDGPRTRIYCLYDEDAVEGSDANEEPLGFDPLVGNWRVSLPCLADDLAWVQGALKKHSDRITARNRDADIEVAKPQDSKAAQPLVLDTKGFLNP
jgi:hypothetical protein